MLTKTLSTMLYYFALFQRSVLSFDFDEDNEATDEETHSPVNEKLGKSQNNSCDAEQIEKETDSNSNDKFQASINTDSQTKLKKRFGKIETMLDYCLLNLR